MELSEIIRAAAARMKDVTVDIDKGMGTVCIIAEDQEDIFMQGDDADDFINEVEELYEKAGDVTEDECALCQAEDYTILWS